MSYGLPHPCSCFFVLVNLCFRFVKGGILSGDAAEETKDVLLLDVASLSLGIEVIYASGTKCCSRGSWMP